MKKQILIFILVIIYCLFFVSAAVNVYVSEDNSAVTSIVLEYDETVTTVGAGGESPYSFWESGCGSFQDITDYSAVFVPDPVTEICPATVMDDNFWEGTIEFCVTSCPCSGCALCTDGAMDSDDGDVIIAPDPDPDEETPEC